MKTTNLATPVASKKTAQSALLRIVIPMTTGFFRDAYWAGPNQVFNAIRALGGEVSIESTNYFNANGVENMGKRWVLMVTANGFTFPAQLIASFADKPNGDVYDLVVTV